MMWTAVLCVRSPLLFFLQQCFLATVPTSLGGLLLPDSRHLFLGEAAIHYTPTTVIGSKMGTCDSVCQYSSEYIFKLELARPSASLPLFPNRKGQRNFSFPYSHMFWLGMAAGRTCCRSHEANKGFCK